MYLTAEERAERGWSESVIPGLCLSDTWLFSRLTVNSAARGYTPVVEMTMQLKEGSFTYEPLINHQVQQTHSPLCLGLELEGFLNNAQAFANSVSSSCFIYYLCVVMFRPRCITFGHCKYSTSHFGQQMMFEICHGLLDNPTWSEFNVRWASLRDGGSSIWCIILCRHHRDGKPEWPLQTIMLAVISADLFLLRDGGNARQRWRALYSGDEVILVAACILMQFQQ